MDPLSALIGAGSSLIGGLMNTSSTQSINAANLQQQIWSAEGGYLPGLRANAEKAGFNPLAVLGSRGPNMAVQVGTNPGSGVAAAGQALSKMDNEAYELGIAEKKEDLAQKAALTKQTTINNAIRQKTLDDLNAGRTVSGPEPVVNTPGGFVTEGLKRFWEKPFDMQDANRFRPGPPVVPQNDWMKFKPRTFQERFFGGEGVY